MPYRTDTRSGSQQRRFFCRYGSDYYYDQTLTVPTSASSQYGWRSFGEAEAARVALAQIQGGARWGDTPSIIAALDRVERAISNPIVRAGILPVHERRYVDQTWSDGFANYSVYPYQWVTQFGLEFGDFSPYNISDAYIRSKGAEMLRDSRPTHPHSSLGQWVGELRDFNSLFRSIGLSKGGDMNVLKAGGTGWLGAQFGWVPFIGDLVKAAQTIIDSSIHIEQFLRDSGKLVHRKRSVTLHQDSWMSSGTSIINPNVANFGNTVAYNTGIGTPYGNITGRYRVGVGFDQLRAAFTKVTATTTTTLRTFARFEYFSFDPDGFLEKLAYYEQQARYLLGLTLTPDLVWELTPWSWMVDWFADIGGFLSYQVSVESDSLVMRQSGAVMEQTSSIAAKCYCYYGSDPSVPFPGFDKPFYNISTSKKTQTRLPSGPYNMGTTWDLSNRQWFIVGALGLTLAPGKQPLL